MDCSAWLVDDASSFTEVLDVSLDAVLVSELALDGLDVSLDAVEVSVLVSLLALVVLSLDGELVEQLNVDDVLDDNVLVEELLCVLTDDVDKLGVVLLLDEELTLLVSVDVLELLRVDVELDDCVLVVDCELVEPLDSSSSRIPLRMYITFNAADAASSINRNSANSLLNTVGAVAVVRMRMPIAALGSWSGSHV